MAEKLISVDAYYISEGVSSMMLPQEGLDEDEAIKVDRIEVIDERRTLSEAIKGIADISDVVWVDAIKYNIASGSVISNKDEDFIRWMLAMVNVGGLVISQPLHESRRTYIPLSEGGLPLTSSTLVLLHEAPRVPQTLSPLLERVNLLKERLSVKDLLVIEVESWAKMNSKLYEAMARAESKFSLLLSERLQRSLLITDGTLRKLKSLKGIAKVGLIKSHRTRYYPNEFHSTLLNLSFGERSPIFRVKLSGTELYTFYLKLGRTAGFGGLIRLEFEVSDLHELSKTLGAVSSDTTDVANRLGALVIEMSGAKDLNLYHLPRWPQNTLPIRMLEKFLRETIPSPTLVKRGVMSIMA